MDIEIYDEKKYVHGERLWEFILCTILRQIYRVPKKLHPVHIFHESY